MSTLLDLGPQQVLADTVLHAASQQPNRDKKILLTHNLGLTRQPEDAHKELSSLGYQSVRTSRIAHQNVPPAGSTRQFTPQSSEVWNYKNSDGSKAEMKMRDSGGTSVSMNAPRQHHERFRQRMEMKPHPAFAKMDKDAKDKEEQAAPMAGKRSKGVEASAEILAMSRNPLYVEAGGPGSGRHAEFGNFKKTRSFEHSPSHGSVVKTHRYEAGHIRVTHIQNYTNPKDGQRSVAYSKIYEHDRGLGEPKSVFEGHPSRAASFLSKRYGID